MFYLKQFFKILLKSPVRGFFLVFFSILLVFSIGQKNYLENQFSKMIPDNQSGDYFYALIASKESYQSVARQMTVLPGVHRAEVLSEEQIKEEVSNILGNLNLNMEEMNLDLNYAGLKITFTKELKPAAQTLVREYLTHLVGEENITLGAVKNIEMKGDRRAQFIGMVKSWGYSIYLFMVFTFWTISLLAVRAKITEASFLLESYQRKKSVGLKVALNGLLLIFLISVSCTFLLGMPELLNLLVALSIFIVGISIHSKKYIWESH